MLLDLKKMSEIYLYVYDLSKGMLKRFSSFFLGELLKLNYIP
jgi:hypothetical protein